jgi:hypothetical protein
VPSIEALKSCATVKLGWFLSDLFNAAYTDILIERLSSKKHPAHILDGAGVPPVRALRVGWVHKSAQDRSLSPELITGTIPSRLDFTTWVGPDNRERLRLRWS